MQASAHDSMSSVAPESSAMEVVNNGVGMSGPDIVPSTSHGQDHQIHQHGVNRPAPPDLADYQTVFTNAKAGMEGVDKEHVKRVVYEMSKDSAHFKNEQRKDEAVQAKIRALKAQAAALTATEIQARTQEMDKRLTMLEAGRDMGRTWLVVDLDAFYAACEEHANPSLKVVPMAVGGMGMITTANYPARKYGVRSAMPGFIGKRLCPELVFVKPNFQRYQEFSERTRVVFARFDPDFEAGSLDEAYLDITDYCTHNNMSGAQVAEQLRLAVHSETGLTCSCGVAPNKMLAKVCSDINKPNGQYVLARTRDAVAAFVATLPVRKVPGVGKVTEQMLSALGVKTCRDLFEQRGMLAALFKPASLSFFMSAALGLGDTRHSPRPAPDSNQLSRKGISVERTFRPIAAKAELEAMVSELVNHLCNDMAREGIEGNNITLKLKATDFKVTTHAMTLRQHASQPSELTPVVTSLLHSQLPITLRLMGVRMAGLRKRNAGNAGATTTIDRFLAQRTTSANQDAARTADSCGNNNPCDVGKLENDDSCPTPGKVNGRHDVNVHPQQCMPVTPAASPVSLSNLRQPAPPMHTTPVSRPADRRAPTPQSIVHDTVNLMSDDDNEDEDNAQQPEPKQGEPSVIQCHMPSWDIEGGWSSHGWSEGPQEQHGYQSRHGQEQHDHHHRHHHALNTLNPHEAHQLDVVQATGLQHYQTKVVGCSARPHTDSNTAGTGARQQQGVVAQVPQCQQQGPEQQLQQQQQQRQHTEVEFVVHQQTKAGSSNAWQCCLCTYAGNHANSLRCDVCDAWRGSREAVVANNTTLSETNKRPLVASKSTNNIKTEGSTKRPAGKQQPKLLDLIKKPRKV